MENFATSSMFASSGNINQMSQIPFMAGVSNFNDIGLANMSSMPNVSQVVGRNPLPIPTRPLSQVWYNCGPDGVGQLVSSNPQSVIEMNSNELARQFNQQVLTPYGNIQLQVQPPPVVAPVIKPDDIPVVPVQKPPAKPRVRHTGNERVPCPICAKTVSSNATLRDHMRTHTGDRPFVCPECGFAFAQRSNLRMHKRLHTGIKPYMCGICEKTFARSSHLPAHMRTHTGEKPFVCDACDHAFITSQQLKNHFRVHTGEKPWKCEICPAAFTHSSSLSIHKKKHSGEKPFQCKKCYRCFFYLSALNKHMKVHTKTKPKRKLKKKKPPVSRKAKATKKAPVASRKTKSTKKVAVASSQPEDD